MSDLAAETQPVLDAINQRLAWIDRVLAEADVAAKDLQEKVASAIDARNAHQRRMSRLREEHNALSTALEEVTEALRYDPDSDDGYAG